MRVIYILEDQMFHILIDLGDEYIQISLAEVGIRRFDEVGSIGFMSKHDVEDVMSELFGTKWRNFKTNERDGYVYKMIDGDERRIVKLPFWEDLIIEIATQAAEDMYGN